MRISCKLQTNQLLLDSLHELFLPEACLQDGVGNVGNVDKLIAHVTLNSSCQTKKWASAASVPTRARTNCQCIKTRLNVGPE